MLVGLAECEAFQSGTCASGTTNERTEDTGNSASDSEHTTNFYLYSFGLL